MKIKQLLTTKYDIDKWILAIIVIVLVIMGINNYRNNTLSGVRKTCAAKVESKSVDGAINLFVGNAIYRVCFVEHGKKPEDLWNKFK